MGEEESQAIEMKQGENKNQAVKRCVRGKESQVVKRLGGERGKSGH